MAYIPNADDPTQPVESQTVESAAQEFRTLKASMLRGLRFPVSDSPTNRGELPTAINRASKLLAFDASGVPTAGPTVAAVTDQVALATAQAAAAAASAASAATDLDTFGDIWLGVKATEPALDNDGNALATGALYFNSTSNIMFVYAGTWLPTSITLSDVVLKSNNLSDLTSAAIARTNLGAGAVGSQVFAAATAAAARLAILALAYTSTTGSAVLPVGTTLQRDAVPAAGYLRFNSLLNQFEGFNGTAWGAVGGGATGASGNSVFYENDQIVTADYTITTGKNAMSAGPVTVESGVTVTVPSGAVWTIV